jgi:hypothetical protein
MASELTHRMLNDWRRAGASCRPAATVEALSEFETRHGVQLPDALRDLLAAADGLDEWASDYFRFHPLAEIAPIDGATPIDGGRLFTFADFMADCYGYAVLLWPDRRAESRVFLVDGPVREKLTDSIVEFFERYLADPESLEFEAVFDDWPPLMLAARSNNLELVKRLLASGADVNERNLPGDTALDWAKSLGHDRVAELLRAHGAVEGR